MLFWDPTWLHVGAKLVPKIQKKNQTEVQNASIFLIGFGTDFCAIRVPSWGHVGLLLAPRSTNKASKIGPNTQDGPRRVPDPSRTPPNIDFGAPGPRFS